MNTDKNNKKDHNNGLYMLLYAFKMRINTKLNKLAKRISCTHDNWKGIYCLDTGLYLYKQCTECGKKSTSP